MTYTINTNTQFNSIEIYFDGIPCEAIRTALKALKFRWHGVKKCWYGFTDEATVREAIDGDNETTAEKKMAQNANKAAVVPSHNIKVGDLFYASWGWEQTNVNFFQVVELVGKSSVRVREVWPELIEETAVSGMSADRTYRLPEPGEMLRASERPTFIEDNKRGDLRRVRPGYGGDCFKVGKPGYHQETAHPYTGKAVYVSWYA